ncbi:MAG: NUDIX hydrolase [Lachnospiraceae bacterium]|nr:NUDIX hydrolase [Lachnospiraceae bacterium]
MKQTDDERTLAWEEVKTEHIIQDEWIDFRRSAYRFPDGTVFEPYYSYSRRDYVVVVAWDEEGNYLCVRQYRQGIGEVTTEFVAGGIERKDGKEYGKGGSSLAEDALEAAKRELKEETGYESDEWESLMKVPSNATMADNYAYLFVAKNCRKVSGQDLDDTEFLNVVRLSPDEIEEKIKAGKFQQAMHILAWLLAKR